MRLSSSIRASRISPVSASPLVQTEPGIQFSTNVGAPLIVAWKGHATADLSCAADQRALALRAYATAVQRALGVRSYRVRSMHFGGSDMINAHSLASDPGYAHPAPVQYRSDSTENFNRNAFSEHAFNDERFRVEAFTTSSFTMTRLTTGSFSNGTFANADFHFDTSDYHSSTFNTSFSPSYSNGGFGGGNLGGGGFGGGSFVTYPSP